MLVAAFFVAYQQLENYVLAPRIMRRPVQLSPAAAFSGGLWYSPTTSTTFSTNSGSEDSRLRVPDSCRGLRPGGRVKDRGREPGRRSWQPPGSRVR